MLSPLQLKEHRFLRCTVEVLPQGLPSGTEEPASSTAQIHTHQEWGSLTDKPREWRVKLGVQFGPAPNSKGCPYRGNFEVIGFFEVLDGWPEDKMEDLVRVNASSLLYGAVREMVLVITGRCSNGPFTLPTASFVPADEPPVAPKTGAKGKSRATAAKG